MNKRQKEFTMKIAIIGSGISGLTCAYYLNKNAHDVFLFESNQYIGGHTHTIKIMHNKEYNIDTGFIVFNEKNYPCFVRLMKELSVSYEDTSMGFSLYSPSSQFQYAGGSINAFFADRKNIINPAFYQLAFQIFHFEKLAKKLIKLENRNLTVYQFLKKHQLSKNLIELYLYPIISALWSTPMELIDEMPMYFVADFLNNHGFLETNSSIKWKIIKNGSCNYIQPMIKDFSQNVFLNKKITGVKTVNNKTIIYDSTGESAEFDKVIIATHSDEALRMLVEPTTLQHEILSKFIYKLNDVILHTDISLLPPKRRAWASWNYWINPENYQGAILTYYMNKLQNITSDVHYCVSLNAKKIIDPEKIIQCFEYSHPQFNQDNFAAQSRQNELNSQSNILFCGAYWGNGFHEAGVTSALQVCKQIFAIACYE